VRIIEGAGPASLDAVPVPLERLEVSAIALDSRAASPGCLFCCIEGEHVDGHAFAADAVARGAVAVLVEHTVAVAVPQVVVDDTRRAMAAISVAFHGDPARAMQVVGVTGTNGKTTTTQLLREVFDEAGMAAEVIGTLSGARTTPEAPELQARLAQLRDAGTTAVAMEVSSHALAMHRVDGTWFTVAVFTNLSRDHLDFHGSLERYFEAKARLFTLEFTNRAVVNLDSPHGRMLRDAATVETTGYSLDQLEDLEVGPTTSRFGWRGQTVELHLGGRFNVSNALAAAEAAVVLGIEPSVVAAGLSRRLVVPGRFEVIDAGQPFAVIVDYAHTPDGLEQVLDSARESGSGEIAVVFGCGGDRDASKRPAMGEVAARLADRVVLTADNSRGEDTGAIIDAVRQGYDRAPGLRRHELVIEPDRREAIRLALARARPGDVVVVAGKGHETTQTIGTEVVPFDDRVVVRELLGAGASDPGATGAA
jgi:UDP-N-acetylmuramoyl-L-alanyl-D-glutamate--2,6-diaminopimelate ligase